MARRIASATSALTRGLLPAASRRPAGPAGGALAAGAQRMGSLLQARLAAQRRAGRSSSAGGARGPAGAGASSAEPAVAEAELDVEAPVCIVTGGSRGIGRSCALALGSVGAKVVVNYASSEAKAQEVADLIEESGGEAICVQGDMGSEDDIKVSEAGRGARGGKGRGLTGRARPTGTRPSSRRASTSTGRWTSSSTTPASPRTR